MEEFSRKLWFVKVYTRLITFRPLSSCIFDDLLKSFGQKRLIKLLLKVVPLYQNGLQLREFSYNLLDPRIGRVPEEGNWSRNIRIGLTIKIFNSK